MSYPSPPQKTPRPRPRVAEKDRLRVSRACAACRARKSRCMPSEDGQCLRCRKEGLICAFGDISESSTPTPAPSFGRGHHHRSSRPRQLKSDRGVGRPRLDSEVRILGGSPDGVSSPGGDYNPRFDDEDFHMDSNPPRKSVTRSQSQSSSNVLGERALLLIEDPDRTQYSGSISNASFLLCVRDALVFKSSESARDTYLLTSKDYRTMKGPDKPEMADISQALKQLPPKEIADFLTHNFFYYVEATFYYCDREWFTRSLASVYSAPTLSDEIDSSFICLALLIFALASQFSNLGSEAKADAELFTTIADPGKKFYEAAQGLMPPIIAKCSMRGIQICLLAALYNLPSSVPDTAYLYMGMAMRMAVASGLHRHTPGASLDPRLVEVRNRLWWTIYCLDRRLSIAFGRPTSIREDEVDAPYPRPYPPLDQPQSESNIRHQIENIKLTKILNQVIDNLPLESKPQDIEELKRKLTEWRSELLLNLGPDDLDPESKTFRATTHLQIHYHYAWLRMGRASLLQLVHDRLRRVEVERPPTAVDLASACVEAARSTIRHIAILKRHNLLCRHSFSDYQGCSSALVILLLNSILERDGAAGAGAGDASTLDQAVDLLRYMSTGGCGGARSDMQTVEQFRALVSGLRDDEPPPPASAKSTPYENWVSWLAEGEPPRASGPAAASTDAASEFLTSDALPDHAAYVDQAMVDSSSAGDFRMFDLDVNGLSTLDLAQIFNGYSHGSFA